MKRILAITTSLILALTLMTACGQSKNEPATTTTANNSASAATTAASAEKHAPVTITMGTASSSGVFYAVGAAMSQATEESSDFLKVMVQATGGGAENTELINAHELELGFASTSHAYCSLTDSGFCEGKGAKDLAGVMALYPNYWHMLVRSDLDVETYADLKGLKVCLGTSVPEITAISRAILKAHGVDPDKDIEAYYLSQDEAVQKLADGDIDAAAIMTGAPAALFTNLTVDDSCHLVTGDPEIIKTLTAEGGELDFVNFAAIPVGTYNNDEEVYCVSSVALLMTYPDMDEDTIYEFCKQVYENWDTICLAHNSMNYASLESLSNTKIPLHAGAEKFYKEVGIID